MINSSLRKVRLTEDSADLISRVSADYSMKLSFSEIEANDDYQMVGEVYNMIDPPQSKLVASCKGVEELYSFCDGGFLPYCISYVILRQSDFITVNSEMNQIRKSSSEVRKSLFRVMEIVDGEYIGVREKNGVWDICYISLQRSDEENLLEGASLAKNWSEFFENLHLANGDLAHPFLDKEDVFDEDDFYHTMVPWCNGE